jgi:hypothetical protein
MNGMLRMFLRPKTNGLLCLVLTSFILACAPHSAAAQFIQQGPKLVGSGAVNDGNGGSGQGDSVALSADGNTAISGGYTDAMTGAAWVFTRSGGVWAQQGSKLVGNDYSGDASQGGSVALSGDGNTAISGGSLALPTGAAWVFTRSGGVWTQQGPKIVTGSSSSFSFGSAVALAADGNTALIGDFEDDNGTGAGWIYMRSNGVWTQQAKLVGNGNVGGSFQGISVALSGDGNTAMLGGSADNSQTGAAWIFTQSNGVWTQQGAKLVGSGVVGAANQGESVSLSADGNTAIMGGPFDNSMTGAAWIFTRSNGTWTQQGTKLVGNGVSASNEFGYSVALSGSGNTAIVGDRFLEVSGETSGGAFVFVRSNGVWTQTGSPLIGTGGTGSPENQGYSVAISADGNTVASGAIGDTSDGAGNGAMWIFTRAVPTNTHDFNDDGYSDIAWRDGSGDLALWLMNGTTVLSSGGVAAVPTTWSIVGQRDFNGGGMADLLWRDTSGDVSMWFMNGTTVSSSASVGNVPTNWSVVGVGDFNGDGMGDILWQDTSGDLAVWLMNGTTVLSSAGIGNVPTATWKVAGIGDFNGDGMSDILWRDTAGDTSIWFMNGTTIASTAGVGNIPTTWSVAGTGDFNGDGMTDIVWRDSAGDTSIWLMNGAAVLSAGSLGNVLTTFSIALVGDFNGDGMSDLLWQDNAGNTSIWFMNGTTVASTGAVGNIPTTWTVQSVNAE